MSKYKDAAPCTIEGDFELMLTEVKSEQHRKKELYFAAPWFSTKAMKFYDGMVELVENLNKNGECIYNVFFPRELPPMPPCKAFEADVKAIDCCDVLLAWVDEKDCGTAFEIGNAVAKGKRVILLGYDETTFTESKTNLMLAMSCEGYITISDLVRFLCNLPYEVKKVKSDWKTLE